MTNLKKKGKRAFSSIDLFPLVGFVNEKIIIIKKKRERKKEREKEERRKTNQMGGAMNNYGY